ncbi:formimidoyltransferase-cyclodeaminase isoform X3 [Chiloscyllium plagiosum]|uniref:formimidoyltransferase-cyclodeaminase isoform X3 n=1 Tax=Chiloscyllium plagiosum TaxID=36176 RepID=UPI001CB7B446|nr:formimidoyltransferase-cyclodeaminase isoform X3 [Chiloscyllium plagiosum]
MARLVECVPNFSNGQNKEVIDAIAVAISRTNGCSLLDVDPGPSTNRTVYTFVGSPEAVVEGALNAAQVAFDLIDMTTHRGEHPRLGSLDVCPFIPVRNVDMADCVWCANEFGKRLADNLEVPVYLYAEAARDESRRTLPSIRAGEYEGLPEKLKNPEWSPDFGSTTFVPRWGATVTGARNFLIAFNVNLLSTKEQAHRVALNIREQGRGRDQPGRLNKVQAIGWYLEEANIAQVSTNLLDFEVTALHTVFEEVCKDAKDLDLPVVGSQIVGLVPLKSIMAAAEFYMKKENLFILEEEHKVRLGAALGSMVGLMTYGKRQFDHLDGSMRKLITPFHRTMNELITMVDDDSNAFNSYMAALKMPKSTSAERERREAAMQDGLKKAINVPLALAEKVNSLWPVLKEMATCGNLACKSDLQVAAKALELGVFGAHYNIIINLKDMKDQDFRTKARARALDLLEEARRNTVQVLELMDKRKE